MTSQFSRRELLTGATSVAAATAGGVAVGSPGAAWAATPTPGCLATPVLKSAQPVVEIGSGRMRGIESSGVRIFKGVPYGASTAGKNRFQPPQAPEHWMGVRDMLLYSAECPYAPIGGGGGGAFANYVPPVEDSFLLYRQDSPLRASEDCLRLNVWAPTGPGKRPVMVYMHGGGYIAGSGNGLLAYDGENLARRGDVVVVTHNHRLNLFGYLDLSSFGGRWAQSANVGMQDIVAVLHWVRDNISALGGDPGNVTVFGQSGGGGKILALMAMPSAKGLFHKAIVQSGGGGAATAQQARGVALDTLAKLGVSESNLDALTELPVQKLCAVAVASGLGGWKPGVDGTVVAAMPGEGEAALAAGVPLLIGTNLNELKNAVDDSKAASFGDADLAAAARKRFGARADDVVAAFRKSHPGRAPIEIWNAIEAGPMRRMAFTLAERKYAVDGKVWQYLFTWATPVLEGRPKTFHSAEIAFVFNNAALCVNQTGGGATALRLAGQMSDSWVAFARHGSPNHAAVPTWAPFNSRHPTMIFDDPCRVQDDPEAEGWKLIAETSQ
jgi:para-nitrobenzyl esterase